jgi:glutamyl-tRNA reductase
MSAISPPSPFGAAVFGTNHRQAPLDFRERVTLTTDEATALLQRIRAAHPDADCFALSTCNRTEVYVLGADAVRAVALARVLLGEMKAVDTRRDAALFYEFHGRAALEQLYRVAAGIDSQMIGETQILQQVQDGGATGIGAGTVDVVGERLLDGAVRCGRRARAETAISTGPLSIAFAAVNVAHKVFGDLAGRAALVVGAGETGTLVARHLREHHVGRLLIANRGLERARAVAAETRGEPMSLGGLVTALAQVDIVITATSAPAHLIDVPAVRTAMKARHNRSFLVVDIGVPRDVAPQVRAIDNVFLHDVDGLQVMIEQTLSRRRREIPRVERIVTEEVDRFLEWHTGLQAGPLVRDLRAHLESLRDQEIARHASQWTPEQREAAEQVLRAFLNKLMHRPTTLLRNAAVQGDRGLRRLQAVREIFGLEPGGDDDIATRREPLRRERPQPEPDADIPVHADPENRHGKPEKR